MWTSMPFECLQSLPFNGTSCTSLEWVFRCLSNSLYVCLMPSSNGPPRCVLQMTQVSSLGPLQLSPYLTRCLIQTTQMKTSNWSIENLICHHLRVPLQKRPAGPKANMLLVSSQHAQAHSLARKEFLFGLAK